jgi:hypothetical protein
MKLNKHEPVESIDYFSHVPKKKFRNRQLQATGKFRWESADGESFYPDEMATPHLFYSVRMLYNHSVAPFLRVGQFKRRAGVADWPVEYRTQAFAALLSELRKRNDYAQYRKHDLEGWMSGELADMFKNALTFAFACQDIEPQVEKDTSAQDVIDRAAERLTAAVEQKAYRKAKRMRRAVESDRWGFPGKRCLEHRSYAGIRKPRVECNACRQVYRARRRLLHSALKG